jgi:hypothetical protein
MSQQERAACEMFAGLAGKVDANKPRLKENLRLPVPGQIF